MVQPARRSLATSPLRETSASKSSRFANDPIVPWLTSIDKEIELFQMRSGGEPSDDYLRLLERCVNRFIDDRRYRDDVRFIKVLVLYGDAIQDLKKVFEMMEEKGVGLRSSLMYEAYAIFLVAGGKISEANDIYQLGIQRNVEHVARLKKIHGLFLSRLSEVGGTPQNSQVAQNTKDDGHDEQSSVNPWLASTVDNLLKKINHHMSKHDGYCKSSKAYLGKVKLSSLEKSSRNKVIELGGKKYHIKGCSGQGGFAQVFKASVDNNPELIVALKIQRPAFPWEFYMYRLLDMKIPDVERSSFGTAHGIYVYSDWSVLVTDYLSHGTLQDAINSYLVLQKHMEEVLCIFYTIEMLRILETLHSVGIIHGDFKPDNLLMRYTRGDELTDDGFRSRKGSWSGLGLCLVDWGRGIDLNLFPPGTEFVGDCRTSGFRCVQMQEDKPWTFQVDTYGLCVIVHMMLHGSYMSIMKKASPDGTVSYKPKLPLKRYWNVALWENLFSTLLNRRSNESDVAVLKSLRESFEDFLLESPQHVKKLKELLAKQRASLCSA
ncbi:protein kinase and Mad3-BUB1-I domain-containing protein isoform X2 [Wolffia australiana]